MHLTEYCSFPPTFVYHFLEPLRHHSGDLLVFDFRKTVEQLMHNITVVVPGHPVKLGAHCRARRGWCTVTAVWLLTASQKKHNKLKRRFSSGVGVEKWCKWWTGLWFKKKENRLIMTRERLVDVQLFEKHFSHLEHARLRGGVIQLQRYHKWSVLCINIKLCHIYIYKPSWCISLCFAGTKCKSTKEGPVAVESHLMQRCYLYLRAPSVWASLFSIAAQGSLCL